MKKRALNFLMGVLLVSYLSPALAADVAINKESNAITVQEMQAAIEAFGVSKQQAKQATSRSFSIIQAKKEGMKKQKQHIALIPSDLLDISPY